MLYVALFVLFVLVVSAVVVVVMVTITKPNQPSQQQLPMAAQPGWYPDSLNPAQLRWFDGHRWTDQVQQR